MARDMTRGGIAGTLAAFSAPLVLSGLLQQLYSWADALIVGNFVGEASLAAIGATGSLSGLFIALVSGFAVGVSIVAAQAYGEGNHAVIGRITGAFLLFLGGLSLLLAAVGVPLAKPLLLLLGTPEDILPLSKTYLSITLAGIPALAVYNVYNAVFRGIGDSRTPLYSIVVSALANVALDVLFVAALGWGVAGAAAATVLSQVAMAAFLAMYAHRSNDLLRIRWGREMFSRDVLGRGLKLSIPTAVQSAVRSVGSLSLQNIMNSFGTQTVAAITTAYRIDSVVLLPVVNLGSGVSTFAAQNIGASDGRRARKGMVAGLVLSVGVSVVVTAFVIPAGGWLMGLFGLTQGAIGIGKEFFASIALFYPAFAGICALNGYLQGRGDVLFTGIAGIAALAMRIALSYLLAPMLSNMVIAWAEVFSWIFHLGLCGFRYVWLRHSDKKTGTEAIQG